MKKNLLLLFLSLFTAISASAAFGTSDPPCYEFSAVNEDGVTIYYRYASITGYKDRAVLVTRETTAGGTYSGDVVIPSSVQDKNSYKFDVVGIDDYAFQRCRNLTSVTIPNTVTSIGIASFQYCQSLKSIKIPDKVTCINASTFSGCTSLTSVELPDGIEEISSKAFANTGIYNNRSNWENGTFYIGPYLIDSDNVSSINVKEGTTLIAVFAFAQNSKLKTVTLPSSVRFINSNAFYKCTALESVKFSSELFEIGPEAFSQCTALKQIELYGKIKYIDRWAFYGCSSLQSANISTVRQIGSGAFESCKALKSFTLESYNPENIQFFEDPFKYCDLSKITLYVPKGCSSLFQADNSWGSFGTIAETSAPYDFSDSGICYVINADGKSVSVSLKSSGGNSYSGDVEIPASVTFNGKTYSVTAIGQGAFKYSDDLKSVSIPSSVTSIESLAFTRCTSLKKVNIPYGVTSLGSYAFNGCTGLSYVSIPGSVKKIGSNAFYNCTALEKVILDANTPYDFTSLGSNLFSGISSKATLYTPRGNSGEIFAGFDQWNCFANYEALDYNFSAANSDGVGIYYRINPDAETVSVYYRTADGNDYTGDVNIPEKANYIIDYTVTGIGSKAFNKCDDLMSVTIPATITSIADNAVYNTTSLKTVTVENEQPSSINTAEGAFSGLNWAQTTLNVPSGSLDLYANTYPWSRFATKNEFDLEKSYDFAAVNADGVIIYYNYGSQGDDAIVTYRNSSLNSYSGDVVVPATVSYKGITYNVKLIGENAFAKCSNLKSVTLPEGIQAINQYAFRASKALSAVNFPSTLTSIAQYAFYGCTALERADLNRGLLEIDQYAFAFCSNLYSVFIPNSVSQIGDRAFYKCTTLGLVEVEARTPASIQLGSNVFLFSLSSDDAFLWVPKGCSDAYKAADQWSDFPEIWDKYYDFCDFYQGTPIYYDFNADGKTVSVTRHGYSTVKGFYSGDVVIPPVASFDNVDYPVTAIGDNAFYKCEDLTSISLPYTIESIGSLAFNSCKRLRSIDIPERVQTIREQTFMSCDSLICVNIPEGVTSIGNQAFYYCYKNMSEISIGSTVTNIGEGAFRHCADLKKVTVLNDDPANITIGNNIFTASKVKNAVLYVPRGSGAKYYAADMWKEFGLIYEIGEWNVSDVNGDGKIDSVDVSMTIENIFDIENEYFNFYDADSNFDGQVDSADVVVTVKTIFDN